MRLRLALVVCRRTGPAGAAALLSGAMLARYGLTLAVFPCRGPRDAALVFYETILSHFEIRPFAMPAGFCQRKTSYYQCTLGKLRLSWEIALKASVSAEHKNRTQNTAFIVQARICALECAAAGAERVAGGAERRAQCCPPSEALSVVIGQSAKGFLYFPT